MANKPMGKWIDDIVDATSKYCYIETTDGVLRQGRISGLKLSSLVLNGEKVEIVTEIELNGDISDSVPINRLAKLTIQASRNIS
jgi:hypothetical protein